jgi:hypothetical protein
VGDWDYHPLVLWILKRLVELRLMGGEMFSWPEVGDRRLAPLLYLLLLHLVLKEAADLKRGFLCRQEHVLQTWDLQMDFLDG